MQILLEKAVEIDIVIALDVVVKCSCVVAMVCNNLDYYSSSPAS